jgi:hypothetical protein
MKYLKLFENFQKDEISSDSIKKKIKYLHKIPKEYKEVALNLIQSYTEAKNGKITGLILHPDLEKKIKEGNYPSGFSMGIDKNGYFIYTHRGRSKSHSKPDEITADEMKKTDATG